MKKLIAIALMGCTLLTACGAQTQSTALSSQTASSSSSASAVYHSLTPKEAKARMDSKDEIIVVDVRTKAEYDEGHIENAILIPNEEISTEKPEQLPDLDAEILVYCRSGRRSKEAANKLVDMGYTNVYDFGGIIDWEYEVVS